MSPTNEDRPGSTGLPLAAAKASRPGSVSETIAPGETARGLTAETIAFSDPSQVAPSQTVDFVPEVSGFSRTIDSIPSRSSVGKSGASATQPHVQGYTILSEMGSGGMG